MAPSCPCTVAVCLSKSILRSPCSKWYFTSGVSLLASVMRCCASSALQQDTAFQPFCACMLSCMGCWCAHVGVDSMMPAADHACATCVSALCMHDTWAIATPIMYSTAGRVHIDHVNPVKVKAEVCGMQTKIVIAPRQEMTIRGSMQRVIAAYKRRNRQQGSL